jgi:shikimate dehydrogenase
MRRFGLLGHRLGHSFSPNYFAEKFAREGIRNARYGLFDMPDLRELPGLLQQKDLAGLNVTVPYKETIIPYLDELDGTARAVGAVNTVVLRDGRSVGHNTDIHGFRVLLLPILGDTRPRALVFGSGGASKAVAYVLRQEGIRFRVVAREWGHGDLTYAMLMDSVIKACPLLINTTPVGQYPRVEETLPLPFDAMGEEHMLVDLVYNPEETGFLREGRERGATVCNGLGMLHAQAEASWKLWNDGE